MKNNLVKSQLLHSQTVLDHYSLSALLDKLHGVYFVLHCYTSHRQKRSCFTRVVMVQSRVALVYLSHLIQLKALWSECIISIGSHPHYNAWEENVNFSSLKYLFCLQLAWNHFFTIGAERYLCFICILLCYRILVIRVIYSNFHLVWKTVEFLQRACLL